MSKRRKTEYKCKCECVIREREKKMKMIVRFNRIVTKGEEQVNAR